jgi:hypothetical protein
MYIIRTSGASAYSHRREVERPRGYPSGMRERVMRAIGSVTILGGITSLLKFDRTCPQIVRALTLETVQ